MNTVKISGVDINLEVVSKMTAAKVRGLEIFEDVADYDKLLKVIEAMKKDAKKKK